MTRIVFCDVDPLVRRCQLCGEARRLWDCVFQGGAS